MGFDVFQAKCISLLNTYASWNKYPLKLPYNRAWKKKTISSTPSLLSSKSHKEIFFSFRGSREMTQMY